MIADHVYRASEKVLDARVARILRMTRASFEPAGKFVVKEARVVGEKAEERLLSFHAWFNVFQNWYLLWLIEVLDVVELLRTP